MGYFGHQRNIQINERVKARTLARVPSRSHVEHLRNIVERPSRPAPRLMKYWRKILEECDGFMFFLCSRPATRGLRPATRGVRRAARGVRPRPRRGAGMPADRGRQTACKPGSVSARRRRMAIHLGRPSPDASSDQPGRPARKPAEPPPREGRRRAAPIRSCSPWGLPCRRRCRRRGALLPHPFTLARRRRLARTGGLLSVALSLGSPPPGVTRHRVSVEPGLSSPRREPKGGHPTVWRHSRRTRAARRRQARATTSKRTCAVSGSTTPSTRRWRK